MRSDALRYPEKSRGWLSDTAFQTNFALSFYVIYRKCIPCWL